MARLKFIAGGFAVAVAMALAWVTGAVGGTSASEEKRKGKTISSDDAGRAVTEPLRAEHRELLPEIEALAQAGEVIGVAPLAEQREQVHASYRFLSERLIPHAQAEDAVLYEEVDRLLHTTGKTRATDTMRRDHVEVARMTDRLGQLGQVLEQRTPEEREQRELRRVLLGLHAIVRLHFAKEEEVYLPLLDRELSPEDGKRLLERMEKASARSGASAHGH